MRSGKLRPHGSAERGWRSLAEGETLRALRDFDRNYFSGPIERFIYGGNNAMGRFFSAYVRGEAPPPPTANQDAIRQFSERFGKPIGDNELTASSDGRRLVQSFERAGSRTTNVTTGPINVTVNVTTNADPATIGNAAGNAVRDRLRSLLADPAWSGPSPH
jgi:hypothetical protein